MRRPTALSTFVVTVAVLAVIVSMSLRKAAATSDDASAGTSVVYHPVAALTRGESAKVHVTNLSKDQSAPAIRFMIMFADVRGVLLMPERVCEVRASETCTVTLPSSACPAGFTRADDDDNKNGKGPHASRCEFRAVVVGETLACSPTGAAGAEWMTDMELVETAGGSKFVTGPNAVMKLRRELCTGDSDTGSPPPDFVPPDSGTPPDVTPQPDGQIFRPPV
jgi:hypothetical protein